MQCIIFSLLAVSIFITQTSATCGTLAPKVANSNVRLGAGGPLLGTACGVGQICFNFQGIDQCFACNDASGSCANWNTNGLCASSFYTTQYKRSYCPRTCGMCATLV